MIDPQLHKFIERAIDSRNEFTAGPHDVAVRLFNGHYEGQRGLVLDVYASTLVIFTSGEIDPQLASLIHPHVLERLPWIDCVIHKHRNTDDSDPGQIIYGDAPTTRIKEHGVTYAVDLLMNQDASFYLDTRNLRQWLKENSSSMRFLNTFAYTGSLGIAALAGGANHVVQLDLNKDFLALARSSGEHNQLDMVRMKLVSADFFTQVARYKRSGKLFDIVVLDPPFFSTTQKGTIDMSVDTSRLVNKVRPLVVDQGYLVVVNNALYLSGTDFHSTLLELTADGYLSIETIVPVPLDVTGFPETIVDRPPVDPSPYNHPTKIAILRVARKK